MEAAISADDSIITAYRCHGWTYTRGRTVKDVLCELAGRIQPENHQTLFKTGSRLQNETLKLLGFINTMIK